MAEEISREQQKDIVRQRQIEIAKSMKVKPDILDILNKVEEWQNREWLYICALDGMPTEQIRTLQESKERPARSGRRGWIICRIYV